MVDNLDYCNSVVFLCVFEGPARQVFDSQSKQRWEQSFLLENERRLLPISCWSCCNWQSRLVNECKYCDCPEFKNFNWIITFDKVFNMQCSERLIWSFWWYSDIPNVGLSVSGSAILSGSVHLWVHLPEWSNIIQTR